MEIYKLKRGYIGNFTNYSKGDRFYKVEDKNGRILWENKSYPYNESTIQEILPELEFVCETDKPLEYYRQAIYTQEQVDEMLKNKP